MKLATSLTAVQWFFKGLFDESPHSLAFAIQHWGGGGFDEDPGLPNALQSMSTAMSQVLELLNLAQSIRWENQGARGENEGIHEYLKNLEDSAYTADDLLSELDYYRLEQQVEQQDELECAASDEDQASTFSSNHYSVEDLDYAASEEDQACTSSSPYYTADDLLSELDYTTDDENQASTSSPPQYPSNEDNRSNIVRRMNENVCRLGNITAALSSVLSLLKLVEDFQPNPHDFPVASHRITASFSSSKQSVLGRDSDRDQIVKLLLFSTPASVSMITIVGTGGIGKTTLARMVYNHEEIKKHFDRRIWLCVSDNFDVARLTREILDDLGVDEFDRTTNLNILQQLVMGKLQSERYLLVLDDVWNDSEEEKWSSLCAPLRSQKAGSRILMTTRLNTVVNIAAKKFDMLSDLSPWSLKGLPEDQSLSLFNMYAFGDRDPSHHPILVEIGKQIVGRLKGSPLAAKTVGGLLRDNLGEDHWRSVLCSDIWQLPQSPDDIMPVLQLSYQHLAPDLQQCFTYCSLFPKDCEFKKDNLVAMWISHGYIRTKSGGNKSMEEIGSECFDNLLSRSFIQASYGVKYVLHDLLHDLAKSVSQNEYLKINWKETKEIISSVRHVYVDSDSLSLLKSCNLRNLRTLIIDGYINDDYNILKEILNGLKSIRVLSLKKVAVEFWSGSIGHLIHLRYLTIKSTELSMSPDSQWRPYHLQWLVFSVYDGDYLVLPAATNYLISLRHFVFDSYSNGWNQISRMSGIRKMTCLQELESFTVGKNKGRKLAELKRLNELRGTIILCSLDNESTKKAAFEANLSKKEGICTLALACDNGHATPQMAEEVFEGLCPPPNIKELLLQFYVGVKSPTWMMTINCLQSLRLYNCFNLKVLPPLGQLPLLRHLQIYGANAVEEIGNNFYGSGVAKYFPCLETLEFSFMQRWMVWSGAEEDTDSFFPRLCELTLTNCPKLKRVPMQYLASVEVLKTNCMVLLAELANLSSLKNLYIRKCEEIQSLPLLPASLVKLEMEYCSQLQSLFTVETETKLPSLLEIRIFYSDELVSVELKCLPSLEKLTIKCCGTIRLVPLLPATLVKLEISWCEMITSFTREQEENLSDLTSLRKINIDGCPLLHSLPLMPASLQHLVIRDCPGLLPRERYQEGGGDWHKISHVSDIDW